MSYLTKKVDFRLTWIYPRLSDLDSSRPKKGDFILIKRRKSFLEPLTGYYIESIQEIQGGGFYIHGKGYSNHSDFIECFAILNEPNQ